MKKSILRVNACQRQYDQLRKSLSQIGYISQGNVLDRSKLNPPRYGYQWTRKVKGKTITVALNAGEYAALKQAIENERRLWKTVRKMEQLSQRVLFKDRSSKSLSTKVLGLI